MKEYTTKDKYSVTADYLSSKQGTLLDIGSRDKILSKRIKNDKLVYKSADLEGDHDYHINLEKDLPFAPNSFDYVVALDVLEHVGQIHFAFDQILRITKKTFVIGLPNMASYHHRLAYLFKGKLATDKYDLKGYDQGDRHRWLTVFPDILNFVNEKVKGTDFIVEKVVVEYEGSSLKRRAAVMLFKLGLISESFAARRIIIFITRK